MATRWLRATVVLAVACLAFTMPASAQAVAAAAFSGVGTVSPGLGVTPAFQTYTLSGSLTGAGIVNGSAVVVNDTCTYSGSSNNALGGDNVAFSLDTESGWCTGTLALSDTFTTLRVGALALEEGPSTLGGVSGLGIHICIWISTQAPPVTSYIHICVWYGG